MVGLRAGLGESIVGSVVAGVWGVGGRFGVCVTVEVGRVVLGCGFYFRG